MALTRRHFCGLSCAALGANLAGCAIDPKAGMRHSMIISPTEEKEIGKEAHPRLVQEYGGVYDDPRMAAYIENLGRKVAAVTGTPAENFTFTVLDTPVVNAFVTPGGYIYIARGLIALANSEAELAGVIGHELGHAIARHGVQDIGRAKIANALGDFPGVVSVDEEQSELYLASFSRDQEREADRLGVRYMSDAGYDPGAMTSFLAEMRGNSRLQAQIAGHDPNDVDERDITSTHPRTVERVQQAIKLAGARTGQGLIERDGYLQQIDNMVYGESAEQGYVRDRAFIHPDMRFGFRAPAGFHMYSRPDAVRATNAKNKVLIKFDAAEEPFRGKMTRYLADEWVTGPDLQDLAATRLGGQPAATAWADVERSSEDLLVYFAAIRLDKERIYRFTVLASDEFAGHVPGAFRETIASFRRLSKAEADALSPWRIRIAAVRPGDTAENLGRRMPFATYQAERFRSLNGMKDGDPMVAGTRIKLVVEG